MSARAGALEGLRHQARRILARGGPRFEGPRQAALTLGQLVAAPARVRAAEAELVEVHRAELAWLMRSAARLRIAREPEGRGMLEQCGEEPPSLAAWRAALLDALRCAAADGLRCPRSLAEAFARCAGSAPAFWAPAVELARDALRLQPCAEGRLVLALALLAGGRDAEASRLLAEGVLQTRAGSAVRARWLAALARSERGRDPRRAAHIERLARRLEEAP